MFNSFAFERTRRSSNEEYLWKILSLYLLDSRSRRPDKTITLVDSVRVDNDHWLGGLGGRGNSLGPEKGSYKKPLNRNCFLSSNSHEYNNHNNNNSLQHKSDRYPRETDRVVCLYKSRHKSVILLLLIDYQT